MTLTSFEDTAKALNLTNAQIKQNALASLRQDMHRVGVNFSALEWAARQSQLPGVLGTDYYTISQADCDLMRAQGVGVVRLPFAIERVETTTGMNELVAAVDLILANSMDVILDMHGECYRWLPGANGSYQASDAKQVWLNNGWAISDMAASWVKVASHPHIKNRPGVSFDLMNEPTTTGLNYLYVPVTGTKMLTDFPNITNWSIDNDTSSSVSSVSGTYASITSTRTGNYAVNLTDFGKSASGMNAADGRNLSAKVRVQTAPGSGATVQAFLQVKAHDWSWSEGGPWITLTPGQDTVVTMPVSDKAWTDTGRLIYVTFQVTGGTSAPTFYVDNIQQYTNSSTGWRDPVQQIEDMYNGIIAGLRTAGINNWVWPQTAWCSPILNMASAHKTDFIVDPVGRYGFQWHIYFDCRQTGMYGPDTSNSTYNSDFPNGVEAWADNEKGITSGKYTTGLGGRTYTGAFDMVTEQVSLLRDWLIAHPQKIILIGEMGIPNRKGQADAAQWNALLTHFFKMLDTLPCPWVVTYWGQGPYYDNKTDGRTSLWPADGGKMGGQGILGSQLDVMVKHFGKVKVAGTLPTTKTEGGITPVTTFPYQILATDEIVHCTGTGTVTLPTASFAKGRTVTIGSTSGTITVATSVSGTANRTVAANNSLRVYSDGTGWWLA